jgi:hypothetical protein
MIQIENEEPVAPATEGKETFKVGVHSANSVLQRVHQQRGGKASFVLGKKQVLLTQARKD